MSKQIDVLIGDNSINFGYVCSRALNSHNVSSATVLKDGIDVLNAIITKRPKVAVIEYNMPHIDALGIISFMKYFVDIPVKIIVIGTNSGEAFKTKLYESGAEDYLLKPFDISLLSDKIINLLEISDNDDLNSYSDKAQSVVDEFICEIGLPLNLKGTRYIRKALTMYIDEGSMQAVTKTIYPDIAREFNTSPANIERSIRHVINSYWSRLNREIVEEYFGGLAYEIPTNSAFISTVGYKLKKGCIKTYAK